MLEHGAAFLSPQHRGSSLSISYVFVFTYIIVWKGQKTSHGYGSSFDESKGKQKRILSRNPRHDPKKGTEGGMGPL